MLIHELTIAVQHDRERDVRRALAGRRLLDGCRAVHRGVAERVRAALQVKEASRPAPSSSGPKGPRVDPTRV